ncbi:MAG TPA: four helix bundle protein [Bacteroidales bacterium]|nr:four helix bundle protein [Bacteroidales bacterium]
MDADNEKIFSFFRFEDLRIYHKSIEYIIWVHKKGIAIQKQDHGLLSTRFCHAAQNICSSIAEGSARNKSQFIYYLKMAKSSIRDCVVYTTIAAELGYLTREEQEFSRNYLMEMTKMLGALIGSLQKSAGVSDSVD